MNKTVDIIRYIRYHPWVSTSEVLEALNISEACFYRHKKRAYEILEVEISFVNQNKTCGHGITNYGIIDRDKL